MVVDLPCHPYYAYMVVDAAKHKQTKVRNCRQFSSICMGTLCVQLMVDRPRWRRIRVCINTSHHSPCIKNIVPIKILIITVFFICLSPSN